jgi:hypothetical protein
VRVYQLLCIIQGIRFLNSNKYLHRDFKLEVMLAKFETETEDIFIKIFDLEFNKLYED